MLVNFAHLYIYAFETIKKEAVDGTPRSKDILRAHSMQGSKEEGTRKGERVEQVYDADQSFTDTQGRKERERKKIEETRTYRQCLCVMSHSEVCEKKGQ